MRVLSGKYIYIFQLFATACTWFAPNREPPPRPPLGRRSRAPLVPPPPPSVSLPVSAGDAASDTARSSVLTGVSGETIVLSTPLFVAAGGVAGAAWRPDPSSRGGESWDSSPTWSWNSFALRRRTFKARRETRKFFIDFSRSCTLSVWRRSSVWSWEISRRSASAISAGSSGSALSSSSESASSVFIRGRRPAPPTDATSTATSTASPAAASSCWAVASAGGNGGSGAAVAGRRAQRRSLRRSLCFSFVRAIAMNTADASACSMSLVLTIRMSKNVTRKCSC